MATYPTTRYQNLYTPTGTVGPTTPYAAVPLEIHQHNSNNWVNLLVWFLIITAIVWLFLYVLKPGFIQQKDINGNPTGNIDQTQAILWSLLIAALIVIILYFLRNATGKGNAGRLY